MMGAEQSSTRDQPGSPGSNLRPIQTCYYDLLGVDRQASDDEIKKAYRRKALELHPDRNYTDVENATKKFAQVQSAYEILSDPQERAWYDSHRDAILRNDDQGVEHFEHNVRLTSTDEIVKLIGLFTKNLPFTDAPDGFYGSLRLLFSNLANEEAAACDWEGLARVEYPGFGSAEDDYEETVKPFYAAWIGFSTRKTFSWLDEHRYTEAPDRRIRRLMEKENRRLREDGIREFNDTVRSLVAFVRKRDPRYLRNMKSEADRQRLLREATAAQAARSRAANKVKLDYNSIPEWTKTQDTENKSLSEPETLEEEEYECVTCGKTFKSENQYDTHEKSKKHIKAVQQLKRQMQKEDRLFNLDSQEPINNTASDSELGHAVTSLVLDEAPDHLISTSGAHSLTTSTPISPSQESKESFAEGPGVSIENDTHDDTLAGININDSESGDEYAPRKYVEDRLARLVVTSTSPSDGDDVVDTNIEEHATQTHVAGDRDSQVGHKATTGKARRAKKAARQTNPVSTDSNFRCMTCGQSFASKTRLFNHIKELDHAQPIPGSLKRKQEKRR